MFSATITARFSKACCEAKATCGVVTQIFGSKQYMIGSYRRLYLEYVHSCSGGFGLPFSALANASLSTMGPQAVLINRAVSFIISNCSSPINPMVSFRLRNMDRYNITSLQKFFHRHKLHTWNFFWRAIISICLASECLGNLQYSLANCTCSNHTQTSSPSSSNPTSPCFVPPFLTTSLQGKYISS